MRTVELGRTGERVSQLALGCMVMGTTADEESSVRLLDRYRESGGTFLDTADCYSWWDAPRTEGGQSESLLGRWLAKGGRRDEVFLATKGSAVPRDVVSHWVGDEFEWDKLRYAGTGADTLRAAIDGSLRRLGTDHVDLYYVHVDDRSTPLEETLEALAGIVAAGKARYIGWSNVRTWRLERIRQICEREGWPAPVALQQEHSYLRPRPGNASVSVVGEEQLDYLRANDDLTLVAYSPILKGIYENPEKRRTHHVMASYEGPDSDARIAAVAEVAAEVGVSPNQLVLAWLAHQESPQMVTLLGPRTLEQLDASLPALDLKLTGEQLARLDSAGA
jgi:aryl-alcohol dehydrogenase-like predicted oxidoreductase